MTPSHTSLDQPLYGATFPQAIGRLFKKYATFSGRASRSEYWWSYLFVVGGHLVLGILALTLGVATGAPSGSGGVYMGPGGGVIGVLSIIWFLGTIIPLVAVGVRRLHDANYAGITYLLVLIPWIGGIILIFFLAMRSNPAGARFDLGAAPAYPPAAPPTA
jgi:uncharacterized membrane protein YhaH (DUF805 family)